MGCKSYAEHIIYYKREREKVSAGIPLNIDCEVIDIVQKIRH